MVTTEAAVVRRGSGTVLLDGPLSATLLHAVPSTSFVIHTLAPRGLGSPVHTHAHEDEWSLVLEGELGVQVGQDEWVARPGDFVAKPRGVPHAFWNPGDVPVSFLEVITPAGFESYFERLGELFRDGPVPDMGALSALAADYCLDVDPTSVPRLVQAHQLRLG